MDDKKNNTNVLMNLRSRASSFRKQRKKNNEEENNNNGIPNFIHVFSRFHYDVFDYQADPELDTATDHTKNGMPYRFKPVIVDTWNCEYFNTPYGKARLLRHALFAAIGFIIVGLSSVTSHNAYTYISMILFALLFLSFMFRYYNIALYKIPVPEIPFFSNLMRDTEHYEFSVYERELYRMDGKDIEIDVPNSFFGEEDEEEDSDEDHTYVEEVNRVNGGNKSPGTVLSEYMNNTVLWDAEKMFTETNGVIDEDVLQQLLDDDEDAWSNYKYLKALQEATSADPDRWIQQMEDWKNG